MQKIDSVSEKFKRIEKLHPEMKKSIVKYMNFSSKGMWPSFILGSIFGFSSGVNIDLTANSTLLAIVAICALGINTLVVNMKEVAAVNKLKIDEGGNVKC